MKLVILFLVIIVLLIILYKNSWWNVARILKKELKPSGVDTCDSIKCMIKKFKIMKYKPNKIAKYLTKKEGIRDPMPNIDKIIWECTVADVKHENTWTENERTKYMEKLMSDPFGYCSDINPQATVDFYQCQLNGHSKAFPYKYLENIHGKENAQISSILEGIDAECIMKIPCEVV